MTPQKRTASRSKIDFQVETGPQGANGHQREAAPRSEVTPRQGTTLRQETGPRKDATPQKDGPRRATTSRKEATVGFGASAVFGSHSFVVNIPEGRGGVVVISEDRGFEGQAEKRVILQRSTWSDIAEAARREFNARLRSAKQRPGQWKSGETKVERILGRELCVLAWAAETAKGEQVDMIVKRWLALRPEERWWLFSMTVAGAGGVDDAGRGWRRALFYALSDDRAPAAPAKRGRRKKGETEEEQPTLFPEGSL